MRFQCQEMLIAHRFALGGVGMNLGSVKADVAQLEHPGHVGQQQHLHEQILQFGQERLAKGRQRVVIGVQVASDEAERHGLVGRAFQLARTEGSGGIAVEQQARFLARMADRREDYSAHRWSTGPAGRWCRPRSAPSGRVAGSRPAVRSHPASRCNQRF